jgi:3-dehydroquinate synthase
VSLARIPVLAETPYEVLVGELSQEVLATELGTMLSGALGYSATRVGLVYAKDPNLEHIVGRVRVALGSLGLITTELRVPAGEAGKDAAVAAACWEQLGKAGFTRSDALITVGGGATTDLGGFVAATWLRGIPVVHIPTTLLAMVDAAVGGKTGINTGSGKNLVGCFYEPSGVLCDLTALATLPQPEFVSGLAEVIKCGFIADPIILQLVEQSPTQELVAGSEVTRELVERSITVKASVVSADLKERGGIADHPGREALNYGHTLAHAIERVENYQVRHGEAVSIGCVFVAELSALVGNLNHETVSQHRAVLSKVGLPVSYQSQKFEPLAAAMRIDKKSRGDVLRFVVLKEVGHPVILSNPEPSFLRAAYAAIGGQT